MTSPFSSLSGDIEIAYYYYENNYGGYSKSTEMPEHGEYKRLISKEEYDEHQVTLQEDMWGRQLINEQMASAQEQAAQAEKQAAIEALAAATGLTVEQLQALFQ